MLIQYSRQFSLCSAKASLVRVAYLFVRMFPFCACFLRRSVVYASLPRSHSTRPTLARVSLSAYFSFMRRIICVMYVLNHLNESSDYSIANLFIAGVFLCVRSILLLITLELSLYVADNWHNFDWTQLYI